MQSCEQNININIFKYMSNMYYILYHIKQLQKQNKLITNINMLQSANLVSLQQSPTL